jgi:1-acyl-sn-glycerol-3-phosphate acyltransferase
MRVRRWIEGLPILIFSIVTIPIQYISMCFFVGLSLPFGMLGINAVPRLLMQLSAKTLFYLDGKIIHIYGKNNINPKKNYLFVINHASALDVPAILSFNRKISWLGHHRFLRIPGFGSFLKAIQFIPVYPGDPLMSKAAIDTAIAHAQQLTIAIFPEGTRTRNGKIGPFKKGFVHIMRGSELDILPVTLNGFYTFKPRHRWSVNPFARLEVVIHKPIPRSRLIPMHDDEIVRIVRSKIASAYHDQTEWLFPWPSVLKKQR